MTLDCDICSKTWTPSKTKKNSQTQHYIKVYDDNYMVIGYKLACYQCYKKEQNKRNKNGNIFYKKIRDKQLGDML